MAGKLERINLDGEIFWVEVADLDQPFLGDKVETAAGEEQLVKQIADADIERILRSVISPVRSAMKAIGDVDEFGVELTLGLKAEVGFFLAKGETNASLKLSVKWKAA